MEHQDGYLAQSKEEFSKVIEEIESDETVKNRIKLLLPLLKQINFGKTSVFYEKINDELSFIFSLKNPDFKNSGEIIISLRKNNTKIYLYGCKFYFNDSVNSEETLKFINLILKGSYNIRKVKRVKDNSIILYEVEVSNYRKRRYNSFLSLFYRKKNIYQDNIKGINIISNTPAPASL